VEQAIEDRRGEHLVAEQLAHSDSRAAQRPSNG
jgi:hypothetical protein